MERIPWPPIVTCKDCGHACVKARCCACGVVLRGDDWDRLVAFFDNLRGHWYTGDSRYPGEKERMMFSADVVRQVVRRFRERAREKESNG